MGQNSKLCCGMGNIVLMMGFKNKNSRFVEGFLGLVLLLVPNKRNRGETIDNCTELWKLTEFGVVEINRIRCWVMLCSVMDVIF